MVLYVEDDENDAFFMKRAFAKQGCADSLQVVPNGRNAVEYLDGCGAYADRQRFPLPAVVVLDVKLPEMSGLEVLAWIRSRPEFDALPVVMFTSSTQETDIAFSRCHRADAYIVKPSNADCLTPFVTAVINAARHRVQGTRNVPIEGDLL